LSFFEVFSRKQAMTKKLSIFAKSLFPMEKCIDTTQIHTKKRIFNRFSSNNLQRNGNLLSLPSPMACWLLKFLEE